VYRPAQQLVDNLRGTGWIGEGKVLSQKALLAYRVAAVQANVKCFSKQERPSSRCKGQALARPYLSKPECRTEMLVMLLTAARGFFFFLAVMISG
jgi:hypothetical protein